MPTGKYRIPSQVLTSNSIVNIANSDATFGNLAPLGTFTSIVFPSAFAPIFDVYIFSDVLVTLQRQTAFSVTGPPGDVFRNVGAPLNNAPNVVLEQVGIRTANFFQRWVLTNVDAVPSTVMEVVILNRSI
jgi:hypothetical protein